MSRARTWLTDLVLGARLAVGDRNTPWGRLALMTIGIGIGVLVLLTSAALPNWLQAQHERTAARGMTAVSAGTAHIPAAVLGVSGDTEFRGERVNGKLLQPMRPDAPPPAGLNRLPAPGELVVSPALRDLLADPGSELLRQRLPGTVTGTIGDDGLLAPGELYYYGATTGLTEWNADYRVDDHFGENAASTPPVSVDTLAVWSLGATALLLPVVVFVISTTRLAEAARQRRLAALRLVGASAWQVRRIASGETLIGATTGVLAGWALFIACHAVADRVEVADESMFATDLAPVWWVAVLITLGVPLSTVLISLVALRGAVHDPLRSVRQATPVRRRLWPRLVPLVLGLAGAVFPWPRLDSSNLVRLAGPVTSVALVLLSVTLLLPWIVETAARRARGGPVAWQLALRRLHLTSGTAARSVSAIAVVVTGVIALQTLFASLEHQALQVAGRAAPTTPARMNISGDEDRSGRDGMNATAAAVAALPGVHSVNARHSVPLQSGRSTARVVIADCATAAASFPVGDCRDGDAFLPERPAGEDDDQLPLAAGQQWEIVVPGSNATGAGTITWTIPPARNIAPATDSSDNADLVLTPAAAAGIPMEIRSVGIEVVPTAQAPPDLVEQVRTVAWRHLPFPAVYEYVGWTESSVELRMVKYGLLLGAMVVFTLIGCSLLVTAVEQIHERTRPMAVLGAVGAKRSTLVWSAFLQNAVPMLLALVLAVPLGCLLGALIMVALFEQQPVADLPGMGAVLAFAAVSVLVVTALTAPTLSKAMNAEGLHSE